MATYRDTIIGRVGIAAANGAIIRLDLPGHAKENEVNSHGTAEDTAVIDLAFRQLNEYLRGSRTKFSLPLAPGGTVFQRRIWSAVGEIPYSQTASYRSIAATAGNPRAARAVGGTVGSNPIPVFIPCHRVIGANGAMTGYSGGVTLKIFLLALEKKALPERQGAVKKLT